jgi:hypothetical protein
VKYFTTLFYISTFYNAFVLYCFRIQLHKRKRNLGLTIYRIEGRNTCLFVTTKSRDCCAKIEYRQNYKPLVFIYTYIWWVMVLNIRHFCVSERYRYYLARITTLLCRCCIYPTSDKGVYDLLKPETFGSIQHFVVYSQSLYMPHFLRHTEGIYKWVSLYSLCNRYFSVRSIVLCKCV